MIQIAGHEHEYIECYPVMHQLRPDLSQEEFLRRIAIQTPAGYRMAYLRYEEKIVAVAGYRIAHTLAWGRFLYVDDLITDSTQRSRGFGKQMLDWLIEQARTEGCMELHLDSGMQRTDAHRFYEREKMNRAGYHFAIDVACA